LTKVSITHVSKEFAGGVKGVDDISLEIEEGTFATLLGPSGSGKTTTLRMVAGLETPTSGTIAIGDQTVFGPGVNVSTHRRNIGMVFQSYAVWPHMTVRDNIAFPLKIKGAKSRSEVRKAVEDMIDLVDLSGLGDRLPAELSGGQQQRVALARALIAQPAVLLFDEPLSNLDARLRESMRVLIKDLHEKLKITAIYVTHDQLEAIWLSDVIHVMSKGRIVQSGTPQDIYDAPVSLFVAEFIGQANVFEISEANAASRSVKTGFGARLELAAWRGDPSHVFIRFNKIALRPATADAAAAEPNAIPARVSSIRFAGDRYQLELTTEGDGLITAQVDRLGEISQVGQQVVVVLPPEYLWPLLQ